MTSIIVLRFHRKNITKGFYFFYYSQGKSFRNSIKFHRILQETRPSIKELETQKSVHFQLKFRALRAF